MWLAPSFQFSRTPLCESPGRRGIAHLAIGARRAARVVAKRNLGIPPWRSREARPCLLHARGAEHLSSRAKRELKVTCAPIVTRIAGTAKRIRYLGLEPGRLSGFHRPGRRAHLSQPFATVLLDLGRPPPRRDCLWFRAKPSLSTALVYHELRRSSDCWADDALMLPLISQILEDCGTRPRSASVHEARYRRNPIIRL
jgi:hypothetical protein